MAGWAPSESGFGLFSDHDLLLEDGKCLVESVKVLVGGLLVQFCGSTVYCLLAMRVMAPHPHGLYGVWRGLVGSAVHGVWPDPATPATGLIRRCDRGGGYRWEGRLEAV